MSEKTAQESTVIEEVLTPEESYSFKNLVAIGCISDDFDLVGHPISLRTLSTSEDISVGLLIKPYIGSNAYERAFRTAIVAAAIRTVDGEPLAASLGRKVDDLELLRLKFDKVKEYFPIVIDAIYSRFVQLEKKLIPLASRLGKTQS